MSRGDYDDRDRDDRFDDRDRGRDDDSGGGYRERALAKVKAPAICLMVTAILSLLLVVFGAGWELSGMGEKQRQNQIQEVENDPKLQPQQKKEIIEFTKKIQDIVGPPNIYISWGLTTVFSLLALVGAMKMKNLSGRGWAYTSAILCMTPCTSGCCLLGLPFGIWAMIVLSNPDVKRAFDKRSGEVRDEFDDRGR